MLFLLLACKEEAILLGWGKARAILIRFIPRLWREASTKEASETQPWQWAPLQIQAPHSQEELNSAKESPRALQERPDVRMYMNAVDLTFVCAEGWISQVWVETPLNAAKSTLLWQYPPHFLTPCTNYPPSNLLFNGAKVSRAFESISCQSSWIHRNSSQKNTSSYSRLSCETSYIRVPTWSLLLLVCSG